MRDWSENIPSAESLMGYVDWHQTQKDSKDVFTAKRYAIALKESNLLIGVVGMGEDDRLHEVEMAYFIDEAYRGKGYVSESVTALYDWCMAVSSLEYMILTIDCTNEASRRVAEKSGFELFEKRTPIGYKHPNMPSGSYDYYRKYRA